MKFYVGTSGFSYKEWKGVFYPEDLADKKMLSYYAEHLNTVEINNTFYRLPNEALLRNWAEQVPDDFRFSIKASQKITHVKRLKDTADEETLFLVNVCEALGRKNGVLLFQLPPNMKKDIERLKRFLGVIGERARVAFEFRHESWFESDVFDCMRDHHAAFCVADADNELDVPFVGTTEWGYLRLRREQYTDTDLSKWMKDVKAQSWETAYIFFKHEDKGIGPRLAERFMQMI